MSAPVTKLKPGAAMKSKRPVFLSTQTAPLLQIFLSFLKIGAFTFWRGMGNGASDKKRACRQAKMA